MARTILITGCEERYSALAAGLIGSVEHAARAHQIEIGMLDFGLHDDTRAAFDRRGIKMVTPDWDYDLSLFATLPAPFFKAMTSRPHLRKYFPGYDRYLWMDADTWVQDWNGVELYLASADRFGLAITPEADRSYMPAYSTGSVIAWRHGCFQRCFDADTANKLALYPMINCGVFAARADAPVWDVWSRLLGQIFVTKREPFFFAEQTALNVVIRQKGINAAFLPSTCNWMCNRALPSCSEDGIELCEPNPPFQQLSVIHLTSNTKNGKWPLTTVNGGTYVRSLRFGGHDEVQIGPDIDLPL